MRTSSSSDPRLWLREQLQAEAYPGYVYGYPHKKTYGPLKQPRSLAEVWHGEDCHHLYAYVHVPFCQQRCSFCNLFTYVPGDQAPTLQYIKGLAEEMVQYAQALPGFRFSRLYLGGGTPTFLSTQEIRQLVHSLREHLSIDPRSLPSCIECSPDTLDQQKVETLRELGFRRVSLGVQSFVEEELHQVNRRFEYQQHARVLKWIESQRFPQFNIDLIYGLPGQTLASWQESLQRAIDSPLTSLFLYPLYVRPLTGLAIRGRRPLPCEVSTTTRMAQMYDQAVARLSAAGFRQLTMRQFRRDSDPTDEEEYCCQRDGMVGLGAGARSYTKGLHYSTPWKMVARNIRAVVEEYLERLRQGRLLVFHGFELDDEERQRRWVIQSLLYQGLNLEEFRREFEVCARERFADLWEMLHEERCIEEKGDGIVLTARGVRHADIVGQLFFSERVRQLIAEYEYDT